MKYIVGFIAALIGLTLFGWAFGWFNKGVEIKSAQHVQEQWTEAYSNYASLEQIAQNVCSANKLVTSETDPAIRSQRQTQVMAQEQNYARVSAQYNAAMTNAFQAKLVKPNDLPNIAPSLDSLTPEYGC